MRGLSWEAITKALAHKYIRRYRGKNGKFVYVYPDGSRHGDASVAGHKLTVKDEHLHEGASFSAGAGKGHYKITSAKDGKVTFHHDEDPDKTAKTMTHKEFKAHIQGLHQDAAKRHAQEGLAKRKDILERANKHGTDKHKQRAQAELNRWTKQHKEHVPDEWKTRRSAIARMFVAAKQDNISKEQLRGLLGVKSISEHATTDAIQKLASGLFHKDPEVFSQLRGKQAQATAKPKVAPQKSAKLDKKKLPKPKKETSDEDFIRSFNAGART